MADQTAKSEKKPASSAHEDRWRSGRSRFNLLGFRRGPDSEWYFSGQQPEEQVRMVVRKHGWFLVQPALPFIGCTVALIIIIWAALAFPGAGPIWYLLELAAFMSMLVTGSWFAYKDLIAWWYETYIITNKRLIIARGLLEPTRKVTTLDKVQQVGLDMTNNFWGLFLGFGNVHVYLAGGDTIDMRNVPRPRRVRDEILGIKEELASGKKKDTPPPKPKDAAMMAVLEKLAKEKPVPELPDADENLPPLRNAERFLGPRRTFGGILRIPCNVHYLSGEHTVKYVQRSQYVLWRNLLVPVLLLVVLFPTAVLAPSLGWISGILLAYWWFASLLVLVGILVSMGLVYSNYADDVYIISNRRVIDIERYFIFFFERHDEVEFKNIRDIKVKVESVLQRFLDVGDLVIETPGNTPNITFENVDHPFVLQDEIYGIRAHRDKVDKTKQENEGKKNLYNWFANVVTTLEETTSSRGTPNLRDMDLLSAMASAQAFDLDVVVSGEAVSSPHIPPGCVVRQNPPPGTIMEKGSKIEVVLSKRPVPVD